jgi:hypothetical protein
MKNFQDDFDEIPQYNLPLSDKFKRVNLEDI